MTHLALVFSRLKQITVDNCLISTGRRSRRLGSNHTSGGSATGMQILPSSMHPSKQDMHGIRSGTLRLMAGCSMFLSVLVRLSTMNTVCLSINTKARVAFHRAFSGCPSWRRRIDAFAPWQLWMSLERWCDN